MNVDQNGRPAAGAAISPNLGNIRPHFAANRDPAFGVTKHKRSAALTTRPDGDDGAAAGHPGTQMGTEVAGRGLLPLHPEQAKVLGESTAQAVPLLAGAFKRRRPSAGPTRQPLLHARSGRFQPPLPSPPWRTGQAVVVVVLVLSEEPYCGAAFAAADGAARAAVTRSPYAWLWANNSRCSNGLAI